jgi:hypothetical protein
MTAPTLLERPSDSIQQESPVTAADLTAHRLIATTTTTSARRGLARAHVIVARVLLVGIALQIFFAGIAIFGVYTFLPHMILGSLLIGASFSLPVLALTGHLGRSLVTRSWLLAGLMIVQGLLIDASHVLPLFGAFHPVNAMLLVLVTYSLARPHHNIF